MLPRLSIAGHEVRVILTGIDTEGVGVAVAAWRINHHHLLPLCVSPSWRSRCPSASPAAAHRRASGRSGSSRLHTKLCGALLNRASAVGAGRLHDGVPGAVAEAAVERFGAVDIVCNNAGVSSPGDPWFGPLSTWQWVMGVNFWGVVHGCRAFLPILIERRRPHRQHRVDRRAHARARARVRRKQARRRRRSARTSTTW